MSRKRVIIETELCILTLGIHSYSAKTLPSVHFLDLMDGKRTIFNPNQPTDTFKVQISEDEKNA